MYVEMRGQRTKSGKGGQERNVGINESMNDITRRRRARTYQR